MRAVLGLDTSCYTTSAALVEAESGAVLSSSRRLLSVDAGERGLRQSDGLFQHVKRLPERVEEALRAAPQAEIVAVSASVRPRPAQDSYMPVFRAGESLARAAAALLRAPFFPVSHQEGHVRAATLDSGIDLARAFLALHLSGGTTEVLLCRGGALTLLGGTLDLHAGQLIDRVGVALGLPFPAGPELERLALRGNARGRIGASVREISCNLAGAENKARSWIETRELPPEDVAAEIFDLIARTVLRLIAAACAQTGCDQALLAGGVASSALLREMLLRRARKQGLPCALHFARPELSGDNAVGVALLGADALRAKERESETCQRS